MEVFKYRYIIHHKDEEYKSKTNISVNVYFHFQ